LNDISFCLRWYERSFFKNWIKTDLFWSSIQVIQTALSTGDRLSLKPSISWTTKNFPSNLTVTIEPDIKYQQILGRKL
jgi:hypothetical protein